MPKYFDPVNHPKRSVNKITLYGSVLTVTGGSGTLNITINGILNDTILTYASGLTTDCATWVTDNYDFYYDRGYIVSSAAEVITVVPRYAWDSVNRINVTIPATAEDTLDGTLTSVFEPDLAKAKTWQVTLAKNTVINYPKNAVEGDRIRLEIYNPSTYTVTWETLGFFFVGGTEPTVTTTGYTTVEGVVNESMYFKKDVLTLASTGGSGTAYVSAGGVTKLMLWGVGGSADLDETGEDFYDSFVSDYAAVGIAVTEAAGVVTFTCTTKAAEKHTTSIKNVSGTLTGTIVTSHGGRVLCNTVMLDVKQ